MYININTASKIHPSNSILKCAIIPIIDTEVSFGISFGALSLTTTYSVLNLFINRCGKRRKKKERKKKEERKKKKKKKGCCSFNRRRRKKERKKKEQEHNKGVSSKN